MPPDSTNPSPTWLPDGWSYTPTKPETTCESCGHRTETQTGTLRRRSDGHTWPLIGNRSKAQERAMVEAIVAGQAEVAA